MNNNIQKIRELLNEGDYYTSAKEACLQIEVILREQIIRNLSLFPTKLRLQITQYEVEKGKGQRGIDDFNLGEIVGLYRKTNFFDEYSNIFKKDMTPVKIFNLNSVVEIRNSLNHENNEDFICSEDSARIVLNLLELLVQTFVDSNSIGFGQLVKKGTILVADNKDIFNNSLEKYLSAFDDAINFITGENEDKKLYAIDLGCREGYNVNKIFSRYSNRIEKIFAICETEELYNCAKEIHGNIERIIFKHIEFDENLFDNMVDFLEEQGLEKVDMIYSDGRFRQIKEPDSFYRKVRRNLLNENGGIILKAFDDGSKICFPDNDNILQKIIDKTASLSIVSDRFNGRKIYSHFWKAGFRDIKAFYIINDTIGLDSDERMDLYDESFDYRINYFKKLAENEPTNNILRKEYKEMKQYLNKLQDRFCDDSFYYCETNYIIVARK